MMDKFGEYVKDEGHLTRQQALTSKSYKNVDHSLQDQNTNCELATYGDALLKLAYCRILFEEDPKNITIKKQTYEADKVLVEVIAKHYNLLEHLLFDEKDCNIPKDYKYREPKKGKDSSSKYIATAVEALLAAFYLDNENNLELVLEIVKHWKALVDNPR